MRRSHKTSTQNRRHSQAQASGNVSIEIAWGKLISKTKNTFNSTRNKGRKKIHLRCQAATFFSRVSLFFLVFLMSRHFFLNSRKMSASSFIDKGLFALPAPQEKDLF